MLHYNKYLSSLLNKRERSLRKRVVVYKSQLEEKISFITRTDRNMPHYYPGRGFPPYLLLRKYETSSTDSDGASRIFASSNCSTTSDKETDGSSILSLSRTFSYMSRSSSFTWSDTTSISTAPSTFEYSTSSIGRSIDDEIQTLRRKPVRWAKRIHRALIALALPIDPVVRQLKSRFPTVPL